MFLKSARKRSGKHAADFLSAAALGKRGKTSASCRFSTLDAD